jgi:predicted oxidoreductase
VPVEDAMKTIRFARSALEGSELAYGCWRLAGTHDPAQVTLERRAAAHAAVITAYELGFTLFDHADIYCHGMAETLFGEVLRQVPEMRERVRLVTKCGIRFAGDPDPAAPYRYDFSARHIIAACEGSLKRLGVETIDLYLLHRPDFLCDPAEVAEAFSRLREAGKVREFGVSNFRPSQVAMLQKACPMPLVANQIEFSLLHPEPLYDGTLDQCLTEGLTPMAWSPLAGGILGGRIGSSMNDPQHARKAKLNDALELIARERGVSRAAIALAWLRRHPAGVVPIVGTTQPEHLREAARAAEVELTREEWYRLMEAAHGQRLP